MWRQKRERARFARAGFAASYFVAGHSLRLIRCARRRFFSPPKSSSPLLWDALSGGNDSGELHALAQPVRVQLQSAALPGGNPRLNSSHVGHANAAETASSPPLTKHTRAPMTCAQLQIAEIEIT
jgi:hypothetical protein